MDALLQQRQATFGSSNVYRIPRPPRFADLVGRRVTDGRILESSANVDLRFSWQYRNIDPDAEAVPFDVSGQLHRESNGQPAYVAVAVNGVIRAVTRTWTSRPDGWLATPPLDAWRRGENSVEVFLVEDAAGEPRLARVRTPTSRPEDLNLISGAAQHYWNIRQRGFHRHEGKGDGVFRWTRADAAVTVPLLGRTPAAIHVKIARAADPRARLEIIANGCRVHDGVIPRREWEARLPLDGCRLSGDELTIRLTTSGMRPRRGRDTRVLGVAVRHVILETTAAESAARR